MSGLSVERHVVRSPRHPATKAMEVLFDMIFEEVAALRAAKIIR